MKNTFKRSPKIKKYLTFDEIRSAALAAAPSILKKWLPDGYCEGSEFMALNPRRSDKRFGSFKINLKTGKWADFAIDKTGGDLISLYAYLKDLNYMQAT